MDKAWSAFYPDLLLELPGAPLPLVDHHLRNVVIDFCERSKAYRVDLDPADAVAEQMGYAPTLAAGLDPVEILEVKFSGEVLTEKAPRYLSDKYGDWQSETGTPEHFTQQDGAEVLLVPAPADAAVDAIQVKVAAKPSLDATGVEDWIFSKWRLALVAGCKAAMMAMKDKTWSAPDRVEFYQGLFERALEDAKVAANNGFVRSKPRFSGRFC